jgi:peptide/nickel transport system permease protein
VTLFILSVLVFVLAQVLSGSVGRNILDPLADQQSVDQLNAELGTDRPLIVHTGTGSPAC